MEQPSKALELRGHTIKQAFFGATVEDSLLDWPDTVIFGRTYPTQCTPIKWMTELKKRGKRVIYDMDDDFWEVAKTNPSKLVSSALKDQYEGMIKAADAVITPSRVLAKKFQKYFKKKIFICPNGVDLKRYVERQHKQQPVTVGYMGAASHWKDLHLVGKVIAELSKKHVFEFFIYGLVGEPLEAAIYFYRKNIAYNFTPEKNDELRAAIEFYNQLEGVRLRHMPFMPPELHPSIMSNVDFDIGIAPLEDNVFNSGKSCIKFYEYAAVGTPVLASDVLPYSDEVSYRAKNTFDSWYSKLEKLIVDEKFRKELLVKQQAWVKENRSLEAIGLPWELAAQREGIKGLTVANQR